MVKITDDIAVSESEIKEEFIRAAGPGGQHVNKTSTAVQLRFDVRSSPSLPDEVKVRLTGLAGNRMTEDGELIIVARSHRSQMDNRLEALDRLKELIRAASVRPKTRRKTRMTRAAKLRWLKTKKIRAAVKKTRGPVKSGD
jgi:ribosome-associated protein